MKVDYKSMFFTSSIFYFFVLLIISAAYDDSDLPEKLKKIETFGVYFSLNSTLESYKNYHNLPVVKVLIREISERYPDIGMVDNPTKSHPFVVVEGVHRKTRNIVGHFLARKMGADIVYNPPQFMVHLGGNFSDLALKKAFFGLAGYASACTARHITKTIPAIVSGHWMSQAAFAIAKVYDRVPPPESKVYTWPTDLYQPDIIFFINSHRKSRQKDQGKPENEFLPKFIDVFRNWRHPPVFEINSTYLYEEIANSMIKIINKEFQCNY